MGKPLTVGDVAKLLNVSSDVVRLWEREGKLPAVRTQGGVRLFTQKDVQRLAGERAARRAVK